MSEELRNVLLLAGRLSPAGAEVLRARLARLERRGITATVVCLASAEARGASARSVADAAGVGPPQFVECPGLESRWRRPWVVRELASDQGPTRPDLIHALGFAMAEPALALAERWRVPYLLSLDEFLPVGARLRLSRTQGRGLIVSGRELADDLVATAGIPRRLISVVRPGLVPDIEPMPDASDEAGPAASRLAVVGAASRLISGSGLATFLQAARRVLDSGRDAEFLIAGRGPSEEPLRRLAESLRVSDRVTFADDAADYLPFWRVLDVFCLTTLSPTTGPTLAMALAHGVPAIASDVRGLDGLLADGRAGLLVPPGDPEALAQAIGDLLADPDRARAIGRAGRERVAEEFNPDREADDLVSAYQRAIASETGFNRRMRTYRADRRSAAPL